jgi:uncharacterized protein RhaS with RHS repeats
LGWNDYGARNYDALLGRWLGVDALAEKYVGYNPYVYVANNPISLIDPDGMSIENPPPTGKLGDEWHDSDGDFYNNGDKWVKTEQTLSEATVMAKKPEANDYNASGLGFEGLGFGIDLFGDKMYSGTHWYSYSAGRSYSTKFYGNQHTGSTAGRIAVAKKWAKGAKYLGYGLGVYQAQDIDTQFRNNEINETQMVIEQSSNFFSTTAGIYGMAWGLGWEIGRAITKTDFYHEYIFLPVHPGGRDGLISTHE